jgi:hypothetical protein
MKENITKLFSNRLGLDKKKNGVKWKKYYGKPFFSATDE